jgi:phospholipase C
VTGAGRAHRRRPFSRTAAVVLLSALLAACASPAAVRVVAAPTPTPAAGEAGSASVPMSLPGSPSAPLLGSGSRRPAPAPGPGSVTPAGIHKIRHVIIIMQENRSFDTYFGTYPGADGIPMRHGVPTVCVPSPHHGCVRPYHDTADVNGGGPHGEPNAIADVHGGRMDGFIKQADRAHRCHLINDPACKVGGKPDVMGYHTAAEIPNYWAYAKHFVLADHMFEPVKSWSLPDHLYLVSAWSARCKNSSPMSCRNNISGPYRTRRFDNAVTQELTTGTTSIDLAWTDITWLLHAHHVGWAYYVQAGTQPDCANDSALTCAPVKQSARTPGIWNPLPLFGDVQEDHQLHDIKGLGSYFAAARAGTLPAVSWITPSQPDSEHPPGSVHQGQAYVTALVNAAMESPDWKSTAIFLSWDDWGGFYDNVVPPQVDQNGYGLRVPGIIISPYAKAGFIDHQVLSSDAYLKFIEDDFLGGARLNPATDGRPDPRPDVREDAPILGNLAGAFDFGQRPRKPFLLPTNPPTDSPAIPAYFYGRPACLGCTTAPPG